MICKSIENFLPNCGKKQDYIASLGWSLTYEKNLVSTLWTRDGYQYFYILAFILAFSPLAYLLNSSKFIYKKIKKNFTIIFFFFLDFIYFTCLFYRCRLWEIYVLELFIINNYIFFFLPKIKLLK